MNYWIGFLMGITLLTCRTKVDPIDNTRNVISGSVVNQDGNPIAGAEVLITNETEVEILRATTDELGTYQSVVLAYEDLPLLAQLRNQSNRIDYELDYDVRPEGDLIEIPPLVVRETGDLEIQFVSSSGAVLEASITSQRPNCTTLYRNGMVEDDSACYPLQTRDFTVANNSASVFTLIGSEIVVSATDGTTIVQEVYTLTQDMQNEVFVFD